MTRFAYQSGEEMKKGDLITYGGKPGVVEFVVTGKSGDPEMDWYIDEDPEGGVMVKVESFGNIFLPETDTEEDLIFVSRVPAGSERLDQEVP